MFRLDESIALGRHLLAEVRPLAEESSTIWMERIAAWVDANPAHPHAPVLARKLGHPMECVDLGWTAAWAMSAFQRVQMGHKLAASLMATNPGDDPEVMECKPSVRTLVRGHPQRYHVGKGRLLLKWVNKEPYWKGDPGAPVAVRPHRFPE